MEEAGLSLGGDDALRLRLAADKYWETASGPLLKDVLQALAGGGPVVDASSKRRRAVQSPTFGYQCQERGQGTVLEKVFPEYKTNVKGCSVTAENARIGVCDRFGAEHFDPNETVRWRTLQEDTPRDQRSRPNLLTFT